MKQVWHQSALSTKFAVFFVGLGVVCGITFLWLTAVLSGLTGAPAAPIMVQLFLVLFSVLSFQVALFTWTHSVLPGVFLSMCNVARAAGVEDVFLERCKPMAGCGYRLLAEHAGLSGLLHAFNCSRPQQNSN